MDARMPRATTLLVALLLVLAGVTAGSGGAAAQEVRLTVDVVLSDAPNGVSAFDVLVAAPGEAEVTDWETGAFDGSGGTAFRIGEGTGVGESRIRGQGLDLGDSIGPTDEALVLFTVTFEGDVSEDELKLEVDSLVDDDENDISAGKVELQVVDEEEIDDDSDGSDGDSDSDTGGSDAVVTPNESAVNTSTPTPTPTATPTETPPPTDAGTEMPTETPTPTASPTGTPTPTASPTGTGADEEDGTSGGLIPGFGAPALALALVALALLARRRT
jgi:hypothetical protein